MKTSESELNSATETKERFDSAECSLKYASALTGTATHRREIHCIRNALQDLPRGSLVLDLPSGTGRLLTTLVEMGFRVTEADSSPHMIDRARETAKHQGIATTVEFKVADVFATGFADGSFDGIVCNRLFHHFREAEVRRRALRELHRISRGPVVVSFFCNRSLGSLLFHVKNKLRWKKAKDRIPIAYRTFVQDVESAGFFVVKAMAARPGISKQWYLLLRPAKTPPSVGLAKDRPIAQSMHQLKRLDRVAYEELVACGNVLERNRFGNKVFELPDCRIVKLFRRKRLISSALFSPYALRFARAARLLADRGIKTVEVLGVYRVSAIRRDVVVYRKIEGETLRKVLSRAPDSSLWMTRLAEFFARMHRLGVYFRAFHFGNVIVQPTGEFGLIDVSEASFPSIPLTPPRRAWNFRHLLAVEEDRQTFRRFGPDLFVRLYLECGDLPGPLRQRFLKVLKSVHPLFHDLDVMP